jgi:hypothetical protein
LLMSVIDGARIDLQLGSVDVNAVRDVETFISEDKNLAVIEEPVLRIGAGAILNGNCSTVVVRCCCYALGCYNSEVRNQEGKRGLHVYRR